ncbi:MULTISPECIES: DUF982 domain-containing protein [unclassified Rhizobium]|jgi:hypothetical protein|uniref:DUF982 domain-containing protein n=1 Tax=unclassified Rhizobium TaxID=2613769 RepID=UPI00062A2B1F|nr:MULTISPECIES: DUF982 domain-containing protein [unclassified Rhizobium]KKX34138.1 hypothetical protein YH62_02920 [Rhizobium sp. LC145]OHV76531.1 hypothetical protein LCM4573_13050 [Rhizobium sp. LCM 4573]TKT55415.1 DUF982 domain-containing protein [Rhizobiaceae bacterium LC148]
MRNTSWEKPVHVTFGHLGTEYVKSPFEALALLTDRWPDMRGPEFVRARSACRAALDGRKSPEEARQQFEQAVSEARLYTH